MLFKNILLGLGETEIIGGVSVGIYYGIKGEEKSSKSDLDNTNEVENEKGSDVSQPSKTTIDTDNSDSDATQNLLKNPVKK